MKLVVHDTGGHPAKNDQDAYFFKFHNGVLLSGLFASRICQLGWDGCLPLSYMAYLRKYSMDDDIPSSPYSLHITAVDELQAPQG
jgi:hypothetical protein